MTLFEITGQLRQLWEMLEEGEYDEDMLIDTMESVEGDFTVKAEGYAKIIKQMEADAEAMKKMAEEFAEKKQTLLNGADRLKNRLMLMMDAANIPEIKSEHFNIKPQKAGGVLPLVMSKELKAEDVPERFHKVTVSIDNAKVREALNNNEVLDFAHLGERGRYLKIK